MRRKKIKGAGADAGPAFNNHRLKERLFSLFVLGAGTLVLLILGGFFLTLFIRSMPALGASGLSFVAGSRWAPSSGVFSSFPFIAGTLITSFTAILIALPFSLSLSVMLGEYMKKGALASFFKSVTELIAGIPSVIYGFWGIMILMPVMRQLQMKMGATPYGVGVLTAALVLAVMVIPYSASLGRDVIDMVPDDLKEAAYAMGATRFEVIRHVIVPHAGSGIVAGIFLALGRAVGETMAVTMLIGNSNFIPKSLLGPANTMSSVIANEFGEADGLHVSALMAVGLLLMIVTGLINSAGKAIMKKFTVEGA